MSEDGNSETGTVWPMPTFQFTVTLCGQDVAFQEVSGLDSEAQIIDYRAGNAPTLSTVKMPGPANTGNVSLKRGVFTKSQAFWDWYKGTVMNTVTRETVTIRMLDENGAQTMAWTLSNAWPTKISAMDLNDDSGNALVESLEIAYESLTVSNG